MYWYRFLRLSPVKCLKQVKHTPAHIHTQVCSKYSSRLSTDFIYKSFIGPRLLRKTRGNKMSFLKTDVSSFFLFFEFFAFSIFFFFTSDEEKIRLTSVVFELRTQIAEYKYGKFALIRRLITLPTHS